MKTLLIIILTSIVNFNCYAQIKFESGYFIANDGKRTNCLIKDIDWANNPKEFTYKLQENSESQTARISNVAEFEILHICKYKRFTVNIDRSSEDVNLMNYNPEPNFNEEQLFLKVLVEGKATLYIYEDINLTRFFYSIDSSSVQQLIFKSYLVSDNSSAENTTYKQQLLANLRYSTISASDIDHINYNQHDLVKLFNIYNGSQHSETVTFEQKQKRDLFNLTIRPGLDVSDLKIQNSISKNKVDFGNQANIRLGIEAEIIIPVNRNKWSVIIEPTFQYYNSTVMVYNAANSVTYKSIELPVGIRHWTFLNDRSKIFMDASLIYDDYIKSKITIENAGTINFQSRFSGASFGAGYKYNKFSVEAKYRLSPDMLDNESYWYSHYTTLSIILGYTIFKAKNY